MGWINWIIPGIISKSLPPIHNQPEHFGEQFVVDESGEFICREDQLLIVSSNLSINQAFHVVDSLGGILIPAHVNRKAFGLIEILGFVPQDIPFDALEISRHLTVSEAYHSFRNHSLPSLAQRRCSSSGGISGCQPLHNDGTHHFRT